MSNHSTIPASTIARAAFILDQDARILDQWADTLAKDKGRMSDVDELRGWAAVRRAMAKELNQAL